MGLDTSLFRKPIQRPGTKRKGRKRKKVDSDSPNDVESEDALPGNDDAGELVRMSHLPNRSRGTTC